MTLADRVRPRGLRWGDPRWLAYPALQAVTTARFRRGPWSRSVSGITWGDRGTGYEFLRWRTHRLRGLEGADVFLAGCGRAAEAPSYFPYRPRRIVGVDLFDHSDDWRRVAAAAAGHGIEAAFHSMSLDDLSKFEDASFDVVSSDAVFEHLTDPERVLGEMARILRPGGLMVASFGPVFHSYGGDHVAGCDHRRAFDHVLRPWEEHLAWIRGLPPEGEGKAYETLWAKKGLLNRLFIRDYVRLFESRFAIERLELKLKPEAFAYRRELPEAWQRLQRVHGVPEEDLLSKGVIAYLRRERAPLE